MLCLTKPLESLKQLQESQDLGRTEGVSQPHLPLYDLLDVPYKNNIPLTRMDFLNVKEKKQKHSELHNYSLCSGNKEFIFTDDRLYILDFKHSLIFQNTKLYEIWEPKGQPLYISKNEKEFFTVDQEGLIVLQAFDKNQNSNIAPGHIPHSWSDYRFEKFVVEGTQGIAQLDTDSNLHSQTQLKCVLIKNVNSQGKKFAQIKSIEWRSCKAKAHQSQDRNGKKSNLSQMKSLRRNSNSKDEIEYAGNRARTEADQIKQNELLIPDILDDEENYSQNISQNILVRQQKKICLSKSGINLRLLPYTNFNSLQMVYNPRYSILMTFVYGSVKSDSSNGHGSSSVSEVKTQAITKIFKLRSKKLLRRMVFPVLDKNPVLKIETFQGKFLIRKTDCVYLINPKKCSIFRVVKSQGHHIVFTKEKDYISHPSGRVKFRKELTIIDTTFSAIKGLTIYDIIRIKRGDIILKADLGVIRYYLNITKNCLEFVVRLDHPSEVQPFFDIQKGLLFSTPNINHLKKFYLLTLNISLGQIDLTFHKLFKELTKQFTKRYDRIHSLSQCQRIYFEAVRIFDTKQKNRQRLSPSEYKSLYETLYCIEFDYIENETIIYALACDHSECIVVLGEDKDGYQIGSISVVENNLSQSNIGNLVGANFDISLDLNTTMASQKTSSGQQQYHNGQEEVFSQINPESTDSIGHDFKKNSKTPKQRSLLASSNQIQSEKQFQGLQDQDYETRQHGRETVAFDCCKIVEEELSNLNRSTFSTSRSISNTATYVFSSDKKLFKLTRRDQSAQFIDVSWLNDLKREPEEMQFYDQIGITNFDNFGQLSKTGYLHRYIFHQGKCYFFNGISIVFLDFWKQVRQVLVLSVDFPELLVMHLDSSSQSVMVYDNSKSVYYIKCPPEEYDYFEQGDTVKSEDLMVVKHQLDYPLIKNLINGVDLKLNYIQTSGGKFRFVSGKQVYTFDTFFTGIQGNTKCQRHNIDDLFRGKSASVSSHLNKQNSFIGIKVIEQKLEADGDVIKSPTIEYERNRYCKIVSGECMVDLNSGRSVKWNINQQFSFIHSFVQDFIPECRGRRKSHPQEYLRVSRAHMSQKQVQEFARKHINPTEILDTIMRTDPVYAVDKMDKLYMMSLKFKQLGFPLFELGLDLSKKICFFADWGRLNNYCQCIRWVGFPSQRFFIKDSSSADKPFQIRLISEQTETAPNYARKKRNSLTKIIDFGKQIVSPRPITSLQDRVNTKTVVSVENEFKVIGGSLIEKRGSNMIFEPYESLKPVSDLQTLDDYFQSSSSQGRSLRQQSQDRCTVNNRLARRSSLDYELLDEVRNMDINMLKKQFKNTFKYEQVGNNLDEIQDEYEHPFFEMARPQDKLMGFGRTWEYGGHHHFGESRGKRKLRIAKHIHKNKLPRVYFEELSSRDFCHSTKGKRDALLNLLENFGTFQIEKPVSYVPNTVSKNSKPVKYSTGPKQLKQMA